MLAILFATVPKKNCKRFFYLQLLSFITWPISRDIFIICFAMIAEYIKKSLLDEFKIVNFNLYIFN